MYSNEKKNGFSIIDLFVKIIFAGVFIFILIWLFNKKVPNMKPFYENVFRENIKYMQEAGESYFTDDKMPTEVGGESKITLSEMFEKKLILPFVDEEGNSCNQYESYVSITKTELGYELKTNLVCNNESDYTIKILGCHTYCADNSCNKTCSVEKIKQYQYKKLVNGSKTTYSCPSGYTLKDKKCYKTDLVDSVSAEVTKTDNKVLTEPAKVIFESGSKTKLTTVIAKNTKYVDKITNTTYKCPSEATNSSGSGENLKCWYTKTTEGTSTEVQVPYSCTKYKTESQAYSCTKYKTATESYDCTKYKTETQCSTKYKSESYSCNCSTKFVGGVLKTSCETCYKSVPYQSCKDVNVSYTGTCYKNVEVPYTATCYKNVEVPYTTTCYKTETQTTEAKTETIYVDKIANTTSTCPTGTNPLSTDNTKCYYVEKSYSCPAGTTVSEGEGASLKCYKTTDAKYHYECNDKTYTLKGSKCYKTVAETSTELKCSDGYKLEGKVCNKYFTTSKKATANKVKTSYYTYKWSEKESLSGWTKTGKTKVVDGKEICE